MSTRVIAGIAKGHRLQMVPGDSTRPITDKAKESLFNIINQHIVDASVLDLFGGIGAVGIEALSRGASYVLFTEKNRLAVKTIHENLETTRLKDKADVQMIDAFDLLKNAPPREFDFIYVAPPQYKGMWLNMLRALDNSPAWLTPHTTVIVQIDPREREDVLFNYLRDYDQRRYGKTLLWFFETMVDDEGEA
ncbi:MAG: 16S rRNA (guanine(966)-N(2))-methyltransferase RsmD [Chloroflexota bacterium]